MQQALAMDDRPRLWVPGDWNGFFGLFTNVLLNVIVLTGLSLGVVKMPEDIVYGRILPALGIALPLGNLYYAFLAWRLAKTEGRGNVTAMPYGPSVPHMFIVVFLIMLPIYLQTNDPILAWQAGLAWAFIIGVIVLLGAFVGPTIRKYTPRAAMLGTLAGISIAFISMRPSFQMWEVPWIAFVALAIILISWMANVRLPFGVPGGLAAVIVGTILAWIAVLLGWSGYMEPTAVGESLAEFGLRLPVLSGDVVTGLGDIWPLLATAIPLGVYNFTEAMNNVESASAAGDNYNLRHILLADGLGAVVGSALGSPFPPAVYIGHPGWKAVGGRIGYSLATGVVIALVSFLGLTALLLAIIPLVAILPILLVHRPGDRRPGLPGVARPACAGGGPGDHPEHRRLGPDPGRRRARRGRHLGRAAGLRRLDGHGRGLSRHGAGRRRRRARRPDPRRGRRLHHRSPVPLGRGLRARRRDPRLLRLHPRHPAGSGGIAAGGAGLRADGRDLLPRRLAGGDRRRARRAGPSDEQEAPAE